MNEAWIFRRGPYYALRVWLAGEQMHDIAMVSAQEAVDFLDCRYPGILTHWNI